MLRTSLCAVFLALTLVGSAEIARSASTHLATFLAASAADSVMPTQLGGIRLGTCNPDRITSIACQRRLQIASRF
ncbi:MAG: hypothetical protein ABL908_21375 [Hyphomicrobium sp.]